MCYITIALILSLLYFLKCTVFRFKYDVPGPTPIPLFGNIFLFSNPRKLFRSLCRLGDNYGNLFRVYWCLRLIVVAVSPTDLSKYLGRTADRGPEFTRFVAKVMGDGLLTASVEKWKRHHRVILPTFHSEVLEQFVGCFDKHSCSFVNNMQEKCGVSLFIHKYLTKLTINVVFETIMGVNDENVIKLQYIFSENDSRFLTLMERRFARPWLLIDCIYKMTKEGRELYQIQKDFQNIAHEIITRKLSQRRQHSEYRLSKHQSFIELFMKSEGTLPLTIEEIKDEALTLLLTGFETTSRVLSFSMALLGLNKRWQEKVHKELDEIFSGENVHRSVTADDLKHMNVLESCLKEALRLFPPVTLIPRKLPMDVCMGPNDAVVRRGTIVFSVPYLTHRLPELYFEPKSFNPRRFLQTNSADVPYSYIPFGAGHRSCIGSRYAMILMKTILANTLRKFKIISESSIEELENIEISIVMKPVEEIKIRLESRI